VILALVVITLTIVIEIMCRCYRQMIHSPGSPAAPNSPGRLPIISGVLRGGPGSCLI
jgi:hypothetical protein